MLTPDPKKRMDIWQVAEQAFALRGVPCTIARPEAYKPQPALGSGQATPATGPTLPAKSAPKASAAAQPSPAQPAVTGKLASLLSWSTDEPAAAATTTVSPGPEHSLSTPQPASTSGAQPPAPTPVPAADPVSPEDDLFAAFPAAPAAPPVAKPVPVALPKARLDELDFFDSPTEPVPKGAAAPKPEDDLDFLSGPSQPGKLTATEAQSSSAQKPGDDFDFLAESTVTSSSGPAANEKPQEPVPELPPAAASNAPEIPPASSREVVPSSSLATALKGLKAAKDHPEPCPSGRHVTINPVPQTMPQSEAEMDFDDLPSGAHPDPLETIGPQTSQDSFPGFSGDTRGSAATSRSDPSLQVSTDSPPPAWRSGISKPTAESATVEIIPFPGGPLPVPMMREPVLPYIPEDVAAASLGGSVLDAKLASILQWQTSTQLPTPVSFRPGPPHCSCFLSVGYPRRFWRAEAAAHGTTRTETGLRSPMCRSLKCVEYMAFCV